MTTANGTGGTRWAGLAAVAAALGVPAAGVAQEGGSASGVERPAVIEEITVTARKRTERAQDVPMSISVLTGDGLERLGNDQMRDIGGAFPGVSFNDSNGRNSEFSIRGLTSAGSGSDTSIGLYIDEVFVGNEAAVSQRLFDLQNIQVLRGPQGTLFGRNTVAGAINVVTRKPEPEAGGGVEVTAGNHGLRQYGATINLPLVSDRLMARLTYVNRERDGYLANTANPGEYGNDEDGESVRLHLLARPADDLEVLLSLDGSRDRLCENMFTLVDGDLHDGNDDPDVSAWDEPCGTKMDVKGASLRVDKEFEATTFTSISAYREREEYFLTDRDFTALPILSTGLDGSERHFTQEFRLSGGEGERLNWVAGAFFFDREHYQNTLLQLGPGFLGPGLSNLVQSVAETHLWYCGMKAGVVPRSHLVDWHGEAKHDDRARRYRNGPADRDGAGGSTYTAEATLDASRRAAVPSAGAPRGVDCSTCGLGGRPCRRAGGCRGSSCAGFVCFRLSADGPGPGGTRRALAGRIAVGSVRAAGGSDRVRHFDGPATGRRARRHRPRCRIDRPDK